MQSTNRQSLISLAVLVFFLLLVISYSYGPFIEGPIMALCAAHRIDRLTPLGQGYFKM